MIKPIKWIRPSGGEIETNGRQATIDKYVNLGWKRVKGPTEDKIKKEMDAAASGAATFGDDKAEKSLKAFLSE